MVITRIVSHVRSRLAAGNYKPAGNCHEAALAAGILIAMDPDTSVRLVYGEVRGYPHWWLLVGKEIVDPTEEQFDPKPSPEEYSVRYRHPMDLGEIAWLLRGDVSGTGSG